MKYSLLLMSMILLAGAGCATWSARDDLPPPLVTYDEQGRVLRHVSYHPDSSVRKIMAYQYVDGGVTLQTSTDYHGTNGWTVSETFNMTDSGVGLTKVSQFDADGRLISEKNVMLNPGSRPFKINNRP